MKEEGAEAGHQDALRENSIHKEHGQRETFRQLLVMFLEEQSMDKWVEDRSGRQWLQSVTHMKPAFLLPIGSYLPLLPLQLSLRTTIQG